MATTFNHTGSTSNSWEYVSAASTTQYFDVLPTGEIAFVGQALNDSATTSPGLAIPALVNSYYRFMGFM